MNKQNIQWTPEATEVKKNTSVVSKTVRFVMKRTR